MKKDKTPEGGAFAPGYNKSRDIKSGRTYEAGMKKKLSYGEKYYGEAAQKSAASASSKAKGGLGGRYPENVPGFADRATRFFARKKAAEMLRKGKAK